MSSSRGSHPECKVKHPDLGWPGSLGRTVSSGFWNLLGFALPGRALCLVEALLGSMAPRLRSVMPAERKLPPEASEDVPVPL